MPKRGVNTHENEVMRAFKTVNDTYIEPISFIVPRRSENFQDDIYPPTVGSKAAVTSGEWLNGKTALPPKISMEDLYEGKEPTEVDAAPRPTGTLSAPSPEVAPGPSPSKPVEEPKVEKPEPAPTATREPPSVDENKKSMADMASKFADKDEEDVEDDKDSSSFEEVEKPIERPSTMAMPNALAAEHVKSSGTSTPEPSSPTQPPPAVASPPSKATSAPTNEPAPAASSSSTASSAAGGLRDVLQEIRGMLQTQSKQIEQLTSEVAQLKAKLGEQPG